MRGFVRCLVWVRACLMCCVRSCVKRLGERLRSCVKLAELKVGWDIGRGTEWEVAWEAGSEVLWDVVQGLCEMLDPDMLQVYFRQASSRIQGGWICCSFRVLTKALFISSNDRPTVFGAKRPNPLRRKYILGCVAPWNSS